MSNYRQFFASLLVHTFISCQCQQCFGSGSVLDISTQPSYRDLGYQLHPNILQQQGYKTEPPDCGWAAGIETFLFYLVPNQQAQLSSFHTKTGVKIWAQFPIKKRETIFTVANTLRYLIKLQNQLCEFESGTFSWIRIMTYLFRIRQS